MPVTKRQRLNDHHENERLVGSFFRFGKDGPVYEVMQLENDEMARICVVRTGEVLSYPIADILGDPEA